MKKETSPKVDHFLRNISSFLHAQLRLGFEYKGVVMLRDENINLVYAVSSRSVVHNTQKKNFALGKLQRKQILLWKFCLKWPGPVLRGVAVRRPKL